MTVTFSVAADLPLIYAQRAASHTGRQHSWSSVTGFLNEWLHMVFLNKAYLGIMSFKNKQ